MMTQPTATSATPQEVVAQNDPELAGALQELVEALKTAEKDSGLPKDSLAGNESMDKILTEMKKRSPDSAGVALTALSTVNANITGIAPEALARIDSSMKNVMRITNREAAAVSRGLEERSLGELQTIKQTLADPNRLPADQMKRLADEGLSSTE
ncbi:MAG: hypothetical protein Athens101428_693 [Candidatus Berkelbacteria bacterium Athens1014_28]|uniref:Uncharacterized protein n=1 Tax=Candidatus Berkelbacteria bacterium Athens1014_28 TaxID=2017145 RepID=A0A554LKD7_9BACT|nr:MAG: hypothetical protein Athens101428_693 [Candidatus Berkelbacteria bacterium Athens1014_28]